MIFASGVSECCGFETMEEVNRALRARDRSARYASRHIGASPAFMVDEFGEAGRSKHFPEMTSVNTRVAPASMRRSRWVSGSCWEAPRSVGSK